MANIKQELMECLEKLENLNPDISSLEQAHLIELAEKVGEDAFGDVAKQAEKLMQMYLNSDIKNAGRSIMLEYFAELDKGAKLLADSGEIKCLPSETQVGTKHAFSTALVPIVSSDALDYCKVLNRTAVPKQLVKAADAFRRRNEVVGTVFEYALRVMWHISPRLADEWSVAQFRSNEGEMDPDIVRDMLAVALERNVAVSDEFLEFTVNVASDENLLEYWPNVTRYADRMLCRQALRRYFLRNKPQSTMLVQLNFLLQNGKFDDERLLSWIKRALNGIGASVQQFMAIEKSELDRKWKALSLTRELSHIADLYVPTLLVADQILSLPDGAHQLAMAFMGLVGDERDAWEESLAKISTRVVIRKIMLDMKNGRSAVDTIRLLTFGDQNAFNAAYAELDLATEKFESMKQRDKVAAILAIYYASYRRPHLLGIEIAKRYRSLMRMIHDDFLSQHLDAEQLKQIHDTGILLEIASIASEARKFLAKRKHDENTLEQMLAAKITFERFVRKMRLKFVR